MKIGISAIALMALFALPAMAGNVTITDLGKPHCAAANPAPDHVIGSGVFVPTAYGNQTSGPASGTTDPWGAWANRAGHEPYSIIGGSAYGAEFASYVLDKPQRSLSMIWGTPDPFNRLAFLKSGSVVGELSGADVAAKVGFVAAYLQLDPGATFDAVRLASSGDYFEYANFNRVCH